MVTRVLHVVAHEDDDLLFMNPDIYETIRAGVPSVTVFVTAGELSGNGSTPGQRARSRQLGMQAAYAEMAGAAAGTTWGGNVLAVAGRQLERYVLTTNPSVELVFLNLPDGRLAAIDGGQSAQSVVVTGGLVATSQTYARATVVAVLRGLLTQYAPTVLRAQDAAPIPNSDHPDHVAAARFAADAATGYTGQLLSVNYRCYNINTMPVNLDAATTAAKQQIFERYTPFDHLAADNGWNTRIYYRWPRSTTWIGNNADGRAQLFLVRNGAVWTYWKTTQGAWTGPQQFATAGGPLSPNLAVGRNADGRMEIFARRMTDHRIVGTYQVQPDGAWMGGWDDHGTPNPGSNQIGHPVFAPNADGRMEIFVKNAGGGVSTRFQTAVNNGWSGWVDLFGTGVQDGLAATLNPEGAIELFAPRLNGVLHWYQSAPNAAFVMNTAFPAPPPAGALAAAANASGAIDLAYRVPNTGAVGLSRQIGPAGAWNSMITTLSGHAGSGTVAMVSAPNGPAARIRLLGRRYDANLRTALQTAVNGAYGSWSALAAGPVVDHPACGTNPDGTVVLAAIGLDGEVYVSEQVSPGAASPFGPWRALPTDVPVLAL